MSKVLIPGLAVLLGAVFAVALEARADTGAVQRVRADVTVKQATNMAVAVSPDGTRIAFDLQGALWTMPARGGAAQRITDIDMESRFPQWSPDSHRLAFQCYRGNEWHICVMDADGTGLRQLTSGAADDREPGWSADGQRIVYVSDENGKYDVWEVEAGSGATHALVTTDGEKSYPAWSGHGDRLAYVISGRRDSRLVVWTPGGGEKTLVSVTGSKRIILPAWHPDGSFITYVQYDEAASTSALSRVDSDTGVSRNLSGATEDVFASRVSWLDAQRFVYAADGGIRERRLESSSVREIPFSATLPIEHHLYTHRRLATANDGPVPVRGILRPHVSPDGRRIVFAALGDLWLLDVGNPEPRRLTNDTALDADPVFSPDGQQVAFTSDLREMGTMDLCLLDLRTGERRVLATPGDSVSLPAFSPDGTRIAFLVANYANWHDRTVHILDLHSGSISKAPHGLFQPSRPSWSPDGRYLAMSALQASSQSFRKGWNQILLMDTRDFSSRFIGPGRGRSLGVRAANGPEWSPDGSRLAYVADGILWGLPMSSTDEPAGPALPLANELVDSLSFTHDGQRMVFLSMGRFRELDLQTGAIQPIALALNWQAPHPGKTVIHAGRLFDAVSTRYRNNMDVVIEGRRIVAVQPSRQDWGSDVRVIDATGDTVMPGMMEAHIHDFTINGEATGRLFLSYGITAIREVGADPYDGLESKESWASGARPGPRSFYSGLLEGERVFYPMSLGIGSGAHLSQELERIKGLDYDLVKTYERLPDAQLARVVGFAHENGLTVTSHDLWPAAAFGQDAVEHLGSEDRREFTDRQSFSHRVYGDVVGILQHSGMTITTTTFAFYPGFERPPGLAHWSPADLTQVRLLPPRYRPLLGAADEGSVSADEQAAWDREERATAAFIAQLRKAGVSVVPGTDGSFFLAGLGMIREMIGIHNGGVRMGDVLQSATRGAARLVGAESELGTLEPGKLADVVVIAGDPLKVPTDLTKVVTVVKDGVVYTQDDLARRQRPAVH